MSGIDMNTSDLSGNESSDGSGRFGFSLVHQLPSFILESPTQMGDENSFDQPYRMRSSECRTPLLSHQCFDFLSFP